MALAFSTSPTACYTQEESLIEFNKQREKTISQKMREADHLVIIESKRAKERLITSTGGSNPQPVPILAHPEEKGKTRDKVADKIGMKHSTFVKASTIWNKAKKGICRHDNGVGVKDTPYLSFSKRDIVVIRTTVFLLIW